jgi:hypothetical protein
MNKFAGLVIAENGTCTVMIKGVVKATDFRKDGNGFILSFLDIGQAVTVNLSEKTLTQLIVDFMTSAPGLTINGKSLMLLTQTEREGIERVRESNRLSSA